MALIDVLLPPSCAGCGRYGSLLCDACRASFRSASPAAVTFVQADPGVVIGESLTLAIAAFRYEAAVRNVLQRLKYGASARLARPLAIAALPGFQRLLQVSGPLTIVGNDAPTSTSSYHNVSEPRTNSASYAASISPNCSSVYDAG